MPLPFQIDTSNKPQAGLFDHLRLRVRPLISLAEEYFGPRVGPYRYQGIHFHAAQPCILLSEDHGITIRLSRQARWHALTAYFELAHEIVHLLSPVGRDEVTVLEEGLATWYSLQVLETIAPGSDFGQQQVYQTPYAEPLHLATQLLAHNQLVVKSLRKMDPIISHLKAMHLARHAPHLEADTLVRLTARFHHS